MGYIDPKLVEGAAALVESFTCAICFNLFEKPRTACSKGHTFCADCLTSLNSRSDPLQFNHKALSHSLPLGSFEHVFGQERFLRSGRHYHFKARLYFSSPFREGSLNDDIDLCTIYVKTLTGKKLCLKVRPDDTILSLKQKIRDKDYIPVAQQRLIFNQQELIDGKRLYDSKVFDGATVHLVLRLARGN